MSLEIVVLVLMWLAYRTRRLVAQARFCKSPRGVRILNTLVRGRGRHGQDTPMNLAALWVLYLKPGGGEKSRLMLVG